MKKKYLFLWVALLSLLLGACDVFSTESSDEDDPYYDFRVSIAKYEVSQSGPSGVGDNFSTSFDIVLENNGKHAVQIDEVYSSHDGSEGDIAWVKDYSDSPAKKITSGQSWEVKATLEATLKKLPAPDLVLNIKYQDLETGATRTIHLNDLNN